MFVRLVLPALVLLASGGAGARADGAALDGIWSGVVTQGAAMPTETGLPGVELYLVAADAAWIAHADGVAAASRSQVAEWTDFEFATGATLRALTRTPSAEAYWIQPLVETAGARYATPVDFASHGAGWRARVQPVADVMTVDLVVRSDQGGLRAVVRNPERNLGVRYGTLEGAIRGEEITLLDARGEAVFRGRLDGATLDLAWLPMDLRVRLERSRAGRPGFHARTEAVAFLSPPRRLEDAWPVATPGANGVDPAPLLRLVRRIADQNPGSLRAETVHHLVLAQHGSILFEESFYGQDPAQPHDTRSAGKSLASTLLAAARVQGFELDADTPALELFGGAVAHVDARKRAMTLGHLMAMTSGLECDDDDYGSQGNEEVMQSQDPESDWYRYALDLPMARAPGAAAVYCSAGVNLVGGAVAEAADVWLPAFFDRHLARPMGMRRYHVNLMPTGQMYLGGGIRLTPRDLLKVGQLMLDDGVWQGARLLPAGWAAQASAAASSIHQRGDYGWNWWRQAFEVRGRVIDTYYASGNGGQLLFVIPELEAVFVILGGNYGNFGTWRNFRDEYVPDYILPALLGAP